MKKLLYIDLEFHRKTVSTRFLCELLEQNFLVEKCFLDSESRIEKVIKEQTFDYYDYLVLFQLIPKRRNIEALSYGKGILFPMYDDAVNRTIDEWNEYRDFTIINFSKTLHAYLLGNGFDSKYIQYFPKPMEIKSCGNANALFFWQRTNLIHINQLLSLCKNLPLSKVHIHKALDPSFYYITVDDRFCYDFSYSSWFPQKADLLEIIAGAAYYAAPRKYEGIGMGFLDAMAMGRCIIAPNYPTMNEYIEDGVNGILYDYENPAEIMACDVRKLQENAYSFIEMGYKKWQREKYCIIEWIEENVDKRKIPILRSSDRKKDAQEKIEESKYYSYYIFMNRWMLLKNRNITLESWFKKRAAFRIAIYGYSEMASRLAEELDKSSVCIVCYIDEKSKWTHDGKITIAMEQLVPAVDMIVVASFFYYDEIKKKMDERFSIKVISLEEIVDDLVKEL